jgi:hypothetical protein
MFIWNYFLFGAVQFIGDKHGLMGKNAMHMNGFSIDRIYFPADWLSSYIGK